MSELEMAEEMVRLGDELVDVARKMRDEAVKLRDGLLDEKYPDSGPGTFEVMGFSLVPAVPAVRGWCASLRPSPRISARTSRTG